MSILNKIFRLKESNTSINKECVAGITTFLTMSYIIFINPQILSSAGMDPNAVFVATCLVTAIGTLLSSLLSNYPIAIAPAMGLNVYFAYVVVQGLGYTWQSALGAVFISGFIFFILTITRIRDWIIKAIPQSLSTAITVGIGLFIAFLGLKSGAIIISNPNTIVGLGDLTSAASLLFIFNFCLMVILDYFKITGAVIISIITTAAIGIFLNVSQFHGIFAWPPSMQSTFLAMDLKSNLHVANASIILAFLLVALFDSTGAFIGLTQGQKLFTQDPKRNKRLSRALMAESIATMTGSVLGTSSTSPYAESAAGIYVGGRTGLTALVVAVLFVLALFLSPLTQTLPVYAVAPALLYIGLLMIQSMASFEFKDVSEFVPGLTTLLMIPFTFSLADGLGLGILSYIIIKTGTGNIKTVHPVLIILGLIFLAYFITQHH